MVYGMITRQGVGPLVFIDGSMDARLYKQVFRLSVYPTLMRQLSEFGEQHSYVDVGASCHDAEATIDSEVEKAYVEALHSNQHQFLIVYEVPRFLERSIFLALVKWAIDQY